ncbi:cytochrome P450 [Punctularia strigosozonata HHB-11173 SS5]|uniref:Cytochrome P450 n=1 Tax=Punctularia strigosozonata (strain HHB-11173) TaxID=741275 RepID=R7S5H0_PUNST|nr:cytochrome P450 [Punctularia strigosozonata HHB-11173 SS5]EIN05202.1 cytochrome P450 [Punctularia strigosozonata HHB-11173 SS5]
MDTVNKALASLTGNEIALSLAVVLLVAIARSSAKRNDGPPLVPYLVPWVGSAVTMGKDPDAFFTMAKEKFGAMFAVKSIGQKLTYVTDPALISAVYRDPKSFEFTPIRLDISQKIFALSHGVCNDGWMTGDYFSMHHRALSPSGIQPLLASYTTHAISCISEALSALPPSTSAGSSPSCKTSLAPLIVPPAFYSAAHTFFGASFPAKDVYGDFRTFDGSFHLMLAGAPKWLVSAPHDAYARILDKVERFLDGPHEDVCQLMHDTEIGARAQGWGKRDIAAAFASDLWALEANAIWAVYWVIALCLQQSHGLEPLVKELQEARAAWSAANPSSPFPSDLLDPSAAVTITSFIATSSLPLLTSSIYEALRYATSSFSIRRVTRDLVFPTNPEAFGLERSYSFTEGERIVCATRAVHQDKGIHDDAEEFKFDRYAGCKMNEGKMGRSQFLPFGGGVSMCEGRHFALGEIKTYLTILLLSATFEVDSGSSARPVLLKERIGVGIMPPKGDLDVIVRRREN